MRAGAPAAAAQHPVREGGESRMAALESQAQAVVLQLDVKMEAPVIIMPRSSDSDDKARKPRRLSLESQNNVCTLSLESFHFHMPISIMCLS